MKRKLSIQKEDKNGVCREEGKRIKKLEKSDGFEIFVLSMQDYFMGSCWIFEEPKEARAFQRRHLFQFLDEFDW